MQKGETACKSSDFAFSYAPTNTHKSLPTTHEQQPVPENSP